MPHYSLLSLLALPFIVCFYLAVAFVAVFGFVAFIVICGVGAELVAVEVRKHRRPPYD